jgi:hypothetical protein
MNRVDCRLNRKGTSRTNLDASNRETGGFEEQSSARGNNALANTGDDTYR